MTLYLCTRLNHFNHVLKLVYFCWQEIIFQGLRLMWVWVIVTGNISQNNSFSTILITKYIYTQCYVKYILVSAYLAYPKCLCGDQSRNIHSQGFNILWSGITTKLKRKNHYWWDQWQHFVTHLTTYQSKPHLIYREILDIGVFCWMRHRLIIGCNIREN